MFKVRKGNVTAGLLHVIEGGDDIGLGGFMAADTHSLGESQDMRRGIASGR